MKICPRCKQGCIVTQRNLEEIIYICDECESVWLDKKKILEYNAIYLSGYLENLGLNHHEVSGYLYEVFKKSGFKAEYLEWFRHENIAIKSPNSIGEGYAKNTGKHKTNLQTATFNFNSSGGIYTAHPLYNVPGDIKEVKY